MSKNASRQVLSKETLGIQGLELFGYSRTTKAHTPMDLHTHPDCIEMVFLLKGSETYYVHESEYIISRGEVFLTFPHELHHTGMHPQGVSEFIWLQLNMSETDGFLGLQNQHGSHLIHRLTHLGTHVLLADKEVLSLIQKSFEAFNTPSYESQMYGLGLLVSMLFRLIYFPASSDIPNFAIKRILNYIDEHICDSISLEELCVVGQLSLSTLQHQFKDLIGQSPRDYINYKKIERAKKLFERGSSITEIAMLLSFSSSDYFSTTFKKYTAQTPSEYINNMSKTP